MPARRPALIFDFGNVIAFFDHARACATFGARLGLSGEAFLGRLRDRGLNAVVEDYERGTLTSEAFSRAVRALAGLEVSHEEFAAAWSDIFWLNEPVAALIGGLKAEGYRLVLGSNTNELHSARFRRQFAETVARFDRLVLSHEIGHVKPSAAFYRACVAAADAAAGDCLFIDDLPANVAGARAAGLDAVLYLDYPGLVADLRARGVAVADPAP